jgi:hypothetical protein
MAKKGASPPPRPYFRYNVAQITTHSLSVLHATMSFKAVKWLRASLTIHNHNKLQNPCCGSKDLRTSCLAPSKCVYQWARSYAGRCNIQRLVCMQYAIPICTRTGFRHEHFHHQYSVVPRRSSPDDKVQPPEIISKRRSFVYDAVVRGNNGHNAGFARGNNHPQGEVGSFPRRLQIAACSG